MTRFTVSIRTDGAATAQSTDDLDAALDWFTNAATEVMDDESDLDLATIQVDGVIWGKIEAGGIEPDPGGEVIPLRQARG